MNTFPAEQCIDAHVQNDLPNPDLANGTAQFLFPRLQRLHVMKMGLGLGGGDVAGGVAGSLAGHLGHLGCA